MNEINDALRRAARRGTAPVSGQPDHTDDTQEPTAGDADQGARSTPLPRRFDLREAIERARSGDSYDRNRGHL